MYINYIYLQTILFFITYSIYSAELSIDKEKFESKLKSSYCNYILIKKKYERELYYTVQNDYKKSDSCTVLDKLVQLQSNKLMHPFHIRRKNASKEQIISDVEKKLDNVALYSVVFYQLKNNYSLPNELIEKIAFDVFLPYYKKFSYSPIFSISSHYFSHNSTHKLYDNIMNICVSKNKNLLAIIKEQYKAPSSVCSLDIITSDTKKFICCTLLKDICAVCFCTSRIVAVGDINGYVHFYTLSTRNTNKKKLNFLYKLITNSENYSIKDISYIGKKKIAIAVHNGGFFIYNIEKREVDHHFVGTHTNLCKLGVTHDKTYLIAAKNNGAIQLWDTKTYHLYHTFIHGYCNPIFSFDCSPDNTLLASGSSNKTVNIWNIVSKELCHTLYGNISPIVALAFDESNCLLGQISQQGKIQVYDTKNNISLFTAFIGESCNNSLLFVRNELMYKHKKAIYFLPIHNSFEHIPWQKKPLLKILS